MDDTTVLTELNTQFIDAFRQGSWETLKPILSEDFQYLDGSTGEVPTMDEYIEDLRTNPQPNLEIDQVVVHVDGDVAIVSSRTSTGTGKYGRYLDTYERRPEGWRCIHACVWPLA